MPRFLGMLVIVAFNCACTIDRIQHDTHAGLDYLRLSNGTELAANTRWQFSPGTRIAVNEIAPAVRGDWVASARDGVGGVFGLQAPTGGSDATGSADLDLLIAWPGDRLASADNAGHIKYLRIDKLIQGSDPMSVRVFLCDARSGTLIQAATLDLSPRWFSPEGARGEHIREAFRDYAMGLVSSF